jgi:hypothetical protein
MLEIILTAVLARLATIKTTNGYLTNAGERVTYYDPYVAEYEGEPEITIRDIEDTSERVNLYHKILINLEVEAIAFTTEETKLADGCNLLSDLVKCLVSDISWYVGGMIAVRRKGRNTVVQGGSKQVIRVRLNLEIEYRELI